MPQETKLPLVIVHAFEMELREVREVSDLLDSFVTARDILFEAGGDPSEPLARRLKRFNLPFRSDLKAMEHLTIYHLDSAIRVLGLQKARLMAQHRQDPFYTTVDVEFKEPLPDELEKCLFKLVHHMKPDLIMKQLYNLIVEKVTENDPEFADVPLADFLFSHLQDEDVDDDEEQSLITRLDKRICVKHAVSCFHAIVQFSKKS